MSAARSARHLALTLFAAAATASTILLLLDARLAMAQAGGTITTPQVIPELPIEVETEVSPAGSLKMIPLWKEIVELLEDPHAMNCPPDDPATVQFDESSECVATTERRDGFGNVMPPLRVINPCFNVLTGQPLRMRPDDEIDWNQPGPLFDPDEVVPVGDDPTGVGPGINIPLELRTIIGSLEVNEENELYVSNPSGDLRIPPDGTVIAEPACNDAGQLIEEDEETGEIVVVQELEQPVNETHFIRNRTAAELLGKALFWDMQVGSDGVQACGSCHFHAGADDRTRNQLNPNTNGGDNTLQITGPNSDVVAADFPFHQLIDPDIVGEPLLNPGNVLSDANDVMSSMGVSEFMQFEDVIVGAGAFGPAVMGVAPLLPDDGTPAPEPIAAMIDENGNKLRRVEPRHTPTFHAAAFNFDNFWDGRARHDFNGGSVFGPADPFFHVYVGCGGQIRELAAPVEAELPLCDWTEIGGNYLGVDEGEEPVPVRIRFSSLASQAVGPPLSEFEMAFGFVDPSVRGGRNWQKVAKKLLQNSVVPLANQLVDPDDSVLGLWSNQGGSNCPAAQTAPGKPGLCISYRRLIRTAFRPALWGGVFNQHLAGTSVPMTNDCEPGEQMEMDLTPTCDPFDGYVLDIVMGGASANDTNEFNLMEANFSLFFGLSVQAYEQLTIPDDTPWDRMNDANPLLGNGIGQPGEQGTLHPSVIRELVTGDPDPSVTLNMIPDFTEEQLFGADIFMGGNMTAALPVGSEFNPNGHGANPFLRTGRCMICHLGPEQTDHTNNVNAGLLQSGTEQEFPFPQTAPEVTGNLRLVTGFSLSEEVEENAQDGVEVENRNFAIADDPATDFDDAQMGNASAIAFQDNGVYNIAVRPTDEDIMRGGDDPFGFPLALAALALKNLGGEDFEPCDTETEAPFHPTGCALPNFDPSLGPGGGLYDTVGEGFPFEGTVYEQDSINPGLELEPANPLLPEYLAEWANNLPAGEVSPFIDELAFGPNTMTAPPSAEYGEILFGADLHCGVFDPAAFGEEPPNFGWGPRCPNSQTGVPVNMQLGDPNNFVPGSLVAPLNGTWGTVPFPNRVARNGAVKVPHLRNVELTAPFFHTGSYLTLRQVIDFYMRGGDFPITNQEDRDPNLVDIDTQAFGFGSTIGLPPEFQDGTPDVFSQYGPMPDPNPPGCEQVPPNCTPEFKTPEEAKVALVKFLLALTDERVAFRAAPFDQPEIFVPIDGRAPANTFGRPGLEARSGVPCLDPDDGVGFTGICFEQVGATGAAGQATRLPNFLGISSTPVAGDNNDHFDR